MLEPLTGNLAYNGTQARAGAQFAIDAINAAGGIKSMGGAKLEAVVVDAQSRPDVAAAAVDKLAAGRRRCLHRLPGECAGPRQLTGRRPLQPRPGLRRRHRRTGRRARTEECLPVHARREQVHVDGAGEPETLNNNAGKPVKTAAIVHEDGPFGSNMAKLLNEKLPQIGIQVVESIGHPTPQRDFTNIVLRLKAAKPDMIIPSNYINEYTLFAMALRQQRLETKAIYSILGGAASNIKFVREHNEAAQYVMDCNHWYDPRKPESQALAKTGRGRQARSDLRHHGRVCVHPAHRRLRSSVPHRPTARR